VSIEDAFGNVESSDDTTQVSISVNACGTTLLGTATVSAGVADFSQLRFFSVTDPATLHLHAITDTALSNDSGTFIVQANPDLLFPNEFEACVP
jgi:hypothetical protein